LARACRGGQKAEFTTGLALLLDVSDIAGAAEGRATVVGAALENFEINKFHRNTFLMS